MRIVLVALGMTGACFAQAACASEQSEKYHLKPATIGDSVLKSAIGILTLNSGPKRGSMLECYILKGKRLVRSRLRKSSEITPVSSYSTSEMRKGPQMMYWRFPLTRRGSVKGKAWMEMVVDPVQDKRVWVRLAYLDKHYDVDVLLFQKGPLKHLVSPMDARRQTLLAETRPTNLDLFFLDKNPIAVYDSARAGGPTRLIRGGAEYNALTCTGGFVELGVKNHPEDFEAGVEVPIWKSFGLVPLRDTKGRLAVWLREAEDF